MNPLNEEYKSTKKNPRGKTVKLLQKEMLVFCYNISSLSL